MNNKKILLLLVIFFCLSHSVFSQYKISQIIDDNKVNIPKPYKYDGFLMNEFTIDLINKDIKLDFVAFKGQKYKLIFCSSTFEEPVIISVYDKANLNVKVAEQTIDSKSPTYTLDLEKPGTYSIVYEIPPSNTEVEHKACMVMLIGFKGK